MRHTKRTLYFFALWIFFAILARFVVQIELEHSAVVEITTAIAAYVIAMMLADMTTGTER